MTELVESDQYIVMAELDESHRTEDFDEIPENWTPEDVMASKWLPSTTVDNDRGFSITKYIASDRRRNMSIETLKSHVIGQCFQI